MEYVAPDLPAPIPTVQEITAAPTGKDSRSSRSTCKFGPYFIKYGSDVYLEEGRNLLFLNQNMNSGIPRLFALWREENLGITVIVQEYIDGETLSHERWATYSRVEKSTLVAQLKEFFSKLRGIKSPNYFGGPNEGFILEGFVGRRQLYGRPFIPACKTANAWVNAMIECVYKVTDRGPRDRFNAFLKTLFHLALDGSTEPETAVFTHSDLSLQNVMVRDGLVVIIDWENAGWYPRYWEYCNLVMRQDCIHGESDWETYIDQFLDRHLLELGWLFRFRTWAMCQG